MKIISKFTDYYDCGLAYGIDEKLYFVRETKMEDINLSIFGKDIYFCKKENKKMRVTAHYKIIGFCGKIYPLVYVTIEAGVKKEKIYNYKLVHELFYYDIDSFVSFKKEYLSIEPMKFDIYGFKEDIFNRDYYSKYRSLFQKLQVPYFLVEEYVDGINKHEKVCVKDRCVLLPCLKTYRFVKVKEPLVAFQEISMYLGTLGLEENKTIVIDDKHLAKSKGYDCYSFKKSPIKRKSKKC